MTQAAVEAYDALPGLPVLYNEELPEDAPQLPAAYFLHQGETPESWGTNYQKPGKVVGRFGVVFLAAGIAAVESMAAALMRAFVPGALAIEAAGPVSLFRSGYTVRGTKLRDKDGNQVHMASVDYEAHFRPPY